ncbi:MAG: TAXI family TRAP transporter solute-binding subunit [Beijerinckiaceae bacterium]
MRQSTLVFLAGLLALIGLGALAYYVVTLPTVLRIAVGPVSSENVRVVAAAIQTLQREREPFRLKLVLTEGNQQSAAAVDEGRADLAVVRTDVAYPRSGASVAVMHVDHVVFVAPGSDGPRAVSDLAGKSIAVIRDGPGNLALARLIISQSGLAPDVVKLERIRLPELRVALEQEKVHAVLTVGPISGRLLYEVISIVADVGKGDINFLPVPEPSAIEQRNPLIEAENLVRGLFGGPTPRPEKDTPTVVVSHHLLAAKTLSDTLVSDFTRVFINAKSQMAAEAPLAARIEAPDQEKESPIPIHPGTNTYIDGQTTTFLERYGDWFYIVIMGVGLGGSAIAAYFSMAAASTRRDVMSLLGEIHAVSLRAHRAEDIASVSELETEARRIFQLTMQRAMANEIDSASTTAFSMAFADVRESLGRRRRELEPQNTAMSVIGQPPAA